MQYDGGRFDCPVCQALDLAEEVTGKLRAAEEVIDKLRAAEEWAEAAGLEPEEER